MKKAIVTGAAGFVGSAVCRALAERGVSVTAVVRTERSAARVLADVPGVRIVCCEMSRYQELPELVSDRDVDAAYHFAWQGSAGPERGDERVQLGNIQATCDLVRACAAMGCGRFVFASSIMEYEIMAQMSADRKPGINTLYSTAKLTADYMAAAVAGAAGVDYIRAVISNIYGPGETSPRLVNTSLRKLLRGEHCAFSAGEQTYDFIYVTDAAAAFAELGEKGVPGRTYYIGSEHPRPLKEFLLEMRDQAAPGQPIGLGEIPFDGVSLTYQEFDVDAVKRDTGFVPSVSFSEGIRRTAQWIGEQEERR